MRIRVLVAVLSGGVLLGGAGAGSAAWLPRRAPARIVHLDTFKAPSGNVGCVLIGVARCDIRQRSWRPPPRPRSCPLDFGQGLLVGSRGRGRFVCAGDTALDPRAAVLPYGEDTQFGPYSCSSRTKGMTCRNRHTAHGFFISRQGYRLF